MLLPRNKLCVLYSKCTRIISRKYSKNRCQYFLSLGNGMYGSPRSLLVDICKDGYFLFNCGEGLVRVFHNNRIPLSSSKLRNVFVTHKSWTNVGGLNHLLLTFGGSHIKDFFLHGPPHIEHISNLISGMIIAPNVKIVKNDYRKGNYSNKQLTVKYVPLFAKDYVDGQLSQPSPICNPIAIAYVCKGVKTSFKFYMEKCMEIGDALTPFLANLKNGEDVTLPDGTLVRFGDVADPERSAPNFIVVECPNEDFLDSLLRSNGFDQSYDGCDKAEVVVHFTPASVMKHEKYREWMNRFQNGCRHLIMNELCHSKALSVPEQFQERLNVFDGNMFPLLKSSDDFANWKEAPTNENEILFHPLSRYFLRPHELFDKWNVSDELEDSDSQIKEMPKINVTSQMNDSTSIPKLDAKIDKNTGSDTLYPEVTFLGTASSHPTKFRNVSGILVKLSDEHLMLMDCGEGTYNQLVMLYGKEGVVDVLQQLRFVFLSHSHIDHYAGLVKILLERKKHFPDPPYLQVIVPKRLLFWFLQYHKTWDHVIHNMHMIWSNDLITGTLESASLSPADRLGLKDLYTVPVNHCHDAFGIVIQHSNGFKLVYSGDTLPCDRLVDAGKHCDLLIHEATHENDKAERCEIVKHTTIGGAIDVAKRMKAKTTLLTHIARDACLVSMAREIVNEPIGFAFDFMKVNPETVKATPKLTKTIMNDFFTEREREEDKYEELVIDLMKKMN